ncbi:Mpo1-like protein [Hydrogenophaga sp.]|uniref:Mpo1 family 2-hydroxy fatty acid dioxygenase n=1 Tax=Hydrogenophaga sp. TaxID=1904254 RepID=UPI0025C6D08D|nr:Mpo1-like protein [Hydrogenophaga sp.]
MMRHDPSVATLLSRPSLLVGDWPVSLTTLLGLGTIVFHPRIDLRLGSVMLVLIGAALLAGQVLAAHTTGVWLGVGLGTFIVGWSIQFLGHWCEGRKPAFVDDIVGLFVGPLFLVAELAFVLRLHLEVQTAIHERLKSMPDSGLPITQRAGNLRAG